MNDPEDEILNGTAGYLQTLLLLKQEMLKSVKPVLAHEADVGTSWVDYTTKIDSIISKVTLKLMAQTTVSEDGVESMQVLFPRYKRRGSLFLGGAHGTLGVLYEIAMACLSDDKIIRDSPGAIELIKKTCEAMLNE